MQLETSIEYIKGIGPQRAELLKKELGVFRLKDLLEHYPFRYIDRTRCTPISELQAESDGNYVQIKGILRQVRSEGQGFKKRALAILRDETGGIELVWFKGFQWLFSLPIGSEFLAFGKLSLFNQRLTMVHPDLELLTGSKTEADLSMSPVYPSTEKLRTKQLDSKGIERIMKPLLHSLESMDIPELLPAKLLQHFAFPSRKEALQWIHFPKDQEQIAAARRRLKFEEFFYMQLRILYNKERKKIGIRGLAFERVGKHFHYFYENNLGFELTNAQKRVLKEIRRDLRGELQMNRLLQGDVGSGKTIVAFMAMLMALDNDYQAALMAPTEILAQQHLQSLLAMAKDMNIRIELLTGSIKGKQRRELLKDLAAGDIDILIGTHALIEDKVVFKNLGFVIVDEQHRFGVMQRAKLWRKNTAGPPHILVMTATPIPRTLAMTVYGDLDVSVIDEMPPGREPIQTFHKYETHRLWVFGQIRQAIDAGRQAYIVYPLIEESGHETMADVNNLMEGVASIEREFPKPKYQISVVHGRQKSEDKDYEMQRFAKGQTQVMVATTVIEVGVNVPNATLMLIENANRFGLAQLHQLRGRVGRGGGASTCILLTGHKLSQDARYRMRVMTESTDGFKISEADLKLRGPGSMEGTQQSGLLNFKIADIVKDAEVLKAARYSVEQVLDSDPQLKEAEHQGLKDYLIEAAKGQGFERIS